MSHVRNSVGMNLEHSCEI